MGRTTVKRTIYAPVDRVFKTVSDINNFSQAVPHIVSAEILSDTKSGLGTRFKETRLMKDKESTTELEITELEITEFVDNDRVRMVADSHGTIWDTVFTVKPAGGSTDLELTMDARAYKLLPKIMNPLIKGMIQKAVERDMDAVKAYCES